MISINDINGQPLNGHQRKTLERILATPASGTIRFADVESLLEALGAEITEGKGSRVRFDLQGEQWHTHRPHPGNEVKRYQVRDLQELFQRLGIR
jgi:HicA toxin of bacterial toxin-antitoxin,